MNAGIFSTATGILIIALSTGNVNAAPQTVTKTSEGTVHSICGSDDGCLRCNKNGSCHELTCTGKGGCRIINYPPPSASKPGTKTGPSPPSTVGTNKGPSPNGGTKPVIAAPISAGANKGPSGGGTITIEKSGDGGKH